MATIRKLHWFVRTPAQFATCGLCRGADLAGCSLQTSPNVVTKRRSARRISRFRDHELVVEHREVRTLASDQAAMHQAHHDRQLTPAQDTPRGQVAVNCPTADEVCITYRAGADRSAVSYCAELVLSQICSRACIRSATISSGARTPQSQANAMYGNARASSM